MGMEIQIITSRINYSMIQSPFVIFKNKCINYPISGVSGLVGSIVHNRDVPINLKRRVRVSFIDK